ADVVPHGRPSFGRRRGLRAGTAGCPYTGPHMGPLSIEPPPPFSCRPGQSGAEPRGLRADRSSGQQALNPSRLAFVSFSLLLPIPGVGRSIRSRCQQRLRGLSSVEPLTTLLAEFGAQLIRSTATLAGSFEPSPALLAEDGVAGIFVLAPGTLHSGSLHLGRRRTVSRFRKSCASLAKGPI